MMMNNIIAIDGPSGSGKSTVAKILSKDLNFQYIDTGAMYRAITYKILKNGVNLDNKEELRELLESTEFDFKDSKLYMDQIEIKDEVRQPEIDANVSRVAADKLIRESLASKQIEIGKRRPSVIDGRDVGTVLFPNAVLKIYLTANAASRARRRYSQNLRKGISDLSIEEIEEEIQKRDFLDTNRELSPLTKAMNSVEIDTSNMTIEETVNMIEGLYKEKVVQYGISWI